MSNAVIYLERVKKNQFSVKGRVKLIMHSFVGGH